MAENFLRVENLLRVDGRQLSQSRRAENLLRLDGQKPFSPIHVKVSDVEKENYFVLASRRLKQLPTFGRCFWIEKECSLHRLRRPPTQSWLL